MDQDVERVLAAQWAAIQELRLTLADIKPQPPPDKSAYHSHGYWFGEGTDQWWRGRTDEEIREHYAHCSTCGGQMREQVTRVVNASPTFDIKTGARRVHRWVSRYWQCSAWIGCLDPYKLQIDNQEYDGRIDGACFCAVPRHDAYPLQKRPGDECACDQCSAIQVARKLA